jgi:hypothetical protein
MRNPTNSLAPGKSESISATWRRDEIDPGAAEPAQRENRKSSLPGAKNLRVVAGKRLPDCGGRSQMTGKPLECHELTPRSALQAAGLRHFTITAQHC